MTKNSDYSEFPDIDKYAHAENLSYEVVVKAFKVEEHFHKQLQKKRILKNE